MAPGSRNLELTHLGSVCTCGLCGETVAKARADRVYRTVQIWQRSVIATRARAVR